MTKQLRTPSPHLTLLSEPAPPRGLPAFFFPVPGLIRLVFNEAGSRRPEIMSEQVEPVQFPIVISNSMADLPADLLCLALLLSKVKKDGL